MYYFKISIISNSKLMPKPIYPSFYFVLLSTIAKFPEDWTEEWFYKFIPAYCQRKRLLQKS